jgi:hypothetical protein
VSEAKDKLEALIYMEAEVKRLVELRNFMRNRGESSPNIDRKIRAHETAIMALSNPNPK